MKPNPPECSAGTFRPSFTAFPALAACAGLLILSCVSPLAAQVDLYSMPQIEDGQAPPPPKPKPAADPFVRALSKKTSVPESAIEDAVDKGFGRMELLRLILISKKSGKPLAELLKEREKGTRLAKIAEDCGQDNKAVRKEAAALLKEIEAAPKPPASAPAKTGTAGTDGTLSKDSKNTP
jgi:hypothetical protein